MMRRLFLPKATAAICVAALSAGCASGPAAGDRAFDGLHLFSDSGSARFSFYYACSAPGPEARPLCVVPAKDFRQWAAARHVAIERLLDDSAFAPQSGPPRAELSLDESSLEYRVVVRFEPRMTASTSSENDGMGGYFPGKAGYVANVYVYATGDARLLAQARLSHRSDTPYKADATPYVRAGAQAVLAALDRAKGRDGGHQ